MRANNWLTQPGAGQAARRRLLDIFNALRDLRLDHHRWAVSEHEGLRERKVGGYIIIYGVDAAEQTVRVVRVFSPFQDQSVL